MCCVRVALRRKAFRSRGKIGIKNHTSTSLMDREREEDPLVISEPVEEVEIDAQDQQSTGLSKKAMKREQRRNAYKEIKKFKKEKKKMLKQEKNAQRLLEPAVHSTEPADPNHAECTQRKRMKKDTFISACANNFHVIIDCDWENDHSDASLTSLTQQIMFCYGIDRRSDHPVTMHLSGLGPRATANLDKVNFRNWAGVSFSSEDYICNPSYSIDGANGTKQLVYLSSDATETMETIDPNCAYIIGGIVDRNRLKGATHRKASDQGIRTVKLPIQQYFALKATPVLTVNHVFDILLTFAETKDWVATLEKVLPKRKDPTKKGDRSVNSAEEEDYGEDDAGSIGEATDDVSKNEDGEYVKNSSSNVIST